MPNYRRNLYILSATIFLAAASWTQVMPFLPLFLKEMGVRDDVLLQWSGVVYSVQSIASIVTLPLWGKLGDKYGQKPMALRAGFCLVGIYFAMSFCTAPWQLALCRFLNGAITGFIPGSVALIATNTPRQHAPRAVATAQTASSAGQIIGPAIGGLLAGIVGYRGSMRISGTAVLISVLLVWILVREAKKPAPTENTSLLQDFMFSLRSPVMASIMLSVMLYGMFVTGVNPILAIHLGNLGHDLPMWLKGAVFSLIPVAFVISAHPWTRYGERCGYQKSIMIGVTGAAACAIAVAFVHNVWLFAAIFFVAGVFLAAISPSAGAIICVKVPEGFRGRAYGMLSSAGTMGALVAPLAATSVAASLGMPSVFAFIGIVFIAGLLIFRLLVGRWGNESIQGG